MAFALGLLWPMAAALGWPVVSPSIAPSPVKNLDRAGIVFVVGGVGGIDMVGPSVRKALRKYGLEHEVRVFTWTHGKGMILKDLQDTSHVLQKADELASEILRYREEQPGRPIFVIGKSGGAGLSLLAAEKLPPDTLERVVLLSAAVTPSYDLRPALRATRGEIVAYYSVNDWFVLGWGTTQFGTIDRVKGPSAGLSGFVKPPELPAIDRVLYERLVQVRWTPAMIIAGNPGGHLANSWPAFVAKEVAPWLKP